MTPVTVTLQAIVAGIAGHDVEGYVPTTFPECPIAVAPYYVRYESGTVWEGTNRWCIAHRVTGFVLGEKSWDSKEAAMAVLNRCDPTFPAWPLATGHSECRATRACYVKFREALAC